jgi:citrate synthase
MSGKEGAALPTTNTGDRPEAAPGKDSLTITDNRTGKTYEIPIENGAIRALDLRPIRVRADDFGLLTYDPGFANTASCKSRITFIDGERGVLNYRGYPIEQLAEHGNYLETAYLLLWGELPTKAQHEAWADDIRRHASVPDDVKKVMAGFRRDAHPMGILASMVAALGTFHPESKKVRDRKVRREAILRLIAQVPTLAAFAYRHSMGRPLVSPDDGQGYCGNFLHMMFETSDGGDAVDPTLARALDGLFVLHADHEQNCSASTMRGVGSSEANPYCAAAGAIGALYGPLHGGANEQVLRMLTEIGSKEKVPSFIKDIKASRGHVRLMGFGHRVYKNYDPRARIIKKMADEVFGVTGRNPALDVALELERIALEDEYFVRRKLYPNVDFYSGLIYQAMKFPVDFFPVLFAIPRMSGWLAQWQEMLEDAEQRISRPRQVYLGPARRDYVPLDGRR